MKKCLILRTLMEEKATREITGKTGETLFESNTDLQVNYNYNVNDFGEPFRIC